MAFVRVTDPELGAELYSNGMMYYTDPHRHSDTPTKCTGGWKSGDLAFEIRTQQCGYRLYIQTEE